MDAERDFAVVLAFADGEEFEFVSHLAAESQVVFGNRFDAFDGDVFELDFIAECD